ncbi:hypothetical protein BZM27_34800 [Paraburkholderia steynii]|uniref:Uncharacterized protein n=1 Tax=Paraburkholderia steynii TaxID=1245441 RepID=A0A4R0X551_9BURK|nr:hypothetical protein BZM27_34800 [Paraburkholderia steynii]
MKAAVTLTPSRLLWGIVALVLLTVAGAIVLEYRGTANPAASVAFDESAKMLACRNDAIQLMKPERLNVATLYDISDLCYTQVRREYLIGNFNIHRYNIVKQEFQTLVVMWMVVAITMSGVFLAGMQLLAAYRLALTGQGQLSEGSDLSLERGKISVKSSVTGLLILTVSLAFFIVYVKWVYALTPDQSSSEASSPLPPSVVPATSEGTILPGVGHAGKPPAQASSSAGRRASSRSPNESSGGTPQSTATP